MKKKIIPLIIFWSGVNATITYSIYRYHLKLINNDIYKDIK